MEDTTSPIYSTRDTLKSSRFFLVFIYLFILMLTACGGGKKSTNTMTDDCGAEEIVCIIDVTNVTQDPQFGLEYAFNVGFSEYALPFESASLQWDFDDDGFYDVSLLCTNKGCPTASYIYQNSDTYKVRLRATIVSHGKGPEVFSIEELIQVQEKQKPIAEFSFTPTNPFNVENTVFTAQDNSSLGISALYEWDFDYNGSSPVFESSNDSPEIDHVFSEPGDYTVLLRVTDIDGNIAEFEQQILVHEAIPPEAKLSYSPVTVIGNQTVTFVSESTTLNEGGSISLIEWDHDNDGTFDSSGQNLELTFDSPGSHSVSLKVTDNLGQSDVITDIVKVLQLPVANFSLSGINVLASENIDADATSSTDEGSIVTYEWDYENDGEFDNSGPTLQLSYPNTGVFTLRLRVTDNDGLTAELTEEISVLEAPSAGISFSPQNPLIGESITLISVSTSNNDGGSIVTHEWDLDNDSLVDSSGESVQTSFDSPGTYPVKLRVIDNYGFPHDIVANITVLKEPFADFSLSKLSAEVNESVTLDGTWSTDDDGTIDLYEWDTTDDGSFDSSGSTTTVSFASEGIYTLRLRVTDNDGLTNEFTKTLTVGQLWDSDIYLAAGSSHVCGIDTGASIYDTYCWGLNSSGQLGDGTTDDSSLPTLVSGGIEFRQISAGEAHTCALTFFDEMYCWGSNEFGQLGDGTNTDRVEPTLVTGGISFDTLAAGGNHTCGRTTDNDVYCWGRNNAGQLGDQTNIDRNTPALIFGSKAITDITAGAEHTCGVGTLTDHYCWGLNNYGQLGDGSTIDKNEPTLISGAHAFEQISAGTGHTCGLTTSSMFCWGDNSSGQLGDGTTESRSVPTEVSDANEFFVDVATGASHTCVSDESTIVCWGDNSNGALGDDTFEDSLTPFQIADTELSTNTPVASGDGFTCISDHLNGVHCWGSNEFGELGFGTTYGPQSTPIMVPRP